jgi:hypothetical protein
VQSGIHDAFAARLTEKVAAMKVGPGTGEGVTIGPLINDKALAKVEAWSPRRWGRAPRPRSAARVTTWAGCSTSPPC